MQTIIGPEFGWKEQTVYLVEVSWSETNPIHRALYYSGFLNGEPEGTPGGYNGVMYPNAPEESPPSMWRGMRYLHYLKVIRVVATADDLKHPS